MSCSGQWIFNPDTGMIIIPPSVQAEVEPRIQKAAEEHFHGLYTRIVVRFRGQFCYIDAYKEPIVTDKWPPKDWPESREAYQERRRNTPTHLCRLRYFGNDRWGFAFYQYSTEKYALSVYQNGDFLGKPEDAFIVSANVYLKD